ncbi:hypothetical protein EV701_14618 [Chthoniobacter flavus]|nr:hypothetical protein EV701_14618 [Chthoniobacter flavus]
MAARSTSPAALEEASFVDWKKRFKSRRLCSGVAYDPSKAEIVVWVSVPAIGSLILNTVQDEPKPQDGDAIRTGNRFEMCGALGGLAGNGSSHSQIGTVDPKRDLA